MRYSAKGLQAYIKEHMPLYIFVSVLFVMGVIFGALMVNALSLEQKQEMSDYLGNFLNTVQHTSDADSAPAFLESFFSHIRWLLLIWILGLSVVGLPLILVLDFLKGVLVGFSVGYLVGQLSWKGMLFALVAIAPQNLIIIPIIIISSVTAVAFSLYLVRYRILHRQGNVKQPFRSYLTVHLSFVGFVIAVACFEAFLSPMLIRWVTPFLM